jgi:hypothetical protein
VDGWGRPSMEKWNCDRKNLTWHTHTYTHVHAFSMGNTFLVSAFWRYWLEVCKVQKNFITFFDDFEWDLGTWVGDNRT